MAIAKTIYRPTSPSLLDQDPPGDPVPENAAFEVIGWVIQDEFGAYRGRTVHGAMSMRTLRMEYAESFVVRMDARLRNQGD